MMSNIIHILINYEPIQNPHGTEIFAYYSPAQRFTQTYIVIKELLQVQRFKFQRKF